MSTSSADCEFEKGRLALAENRPDEARSHFRMALKLEESDHTRMRYLSYVGLSTALAEKVTRESVKACEVAVRRDFTSPEMLLNLGKVYSLAGKTTRALATLERALRMAPNSNEVKSELARVDRRSRPPIPWMSRNHRVNVFLGKVRHAIFAPGARKRGIVS